MCIYLFSYIFPYSYFSLTEFFTFFLLCSVFFLVAHFLSCRAFSLFLTLLGFLPRCSLSLLPSFFTFFLLCSVFFLMAHFLSYQAFSLFLTLFGILPRGSFSLLPSFFAFSYFTRYSSSWLIFSLTELFHFFLLYSVFFLMALFLSYRAFLHFHTLLGFLPRGSFSHLPSFSQFFILLGIFKISTLLTVHNINKFIINKKQGAHIALSSLSIKYHQA